MILQIPTQRVDSLVRPPARAHLTDAAYDLRADEDVTFYPMDRELIRTGLVIAIPPGYCGLILPRSGLAIKNGVTVINAPGLIDSGYRGEIQVALVNLSPETYTVSRGDRIAQLLLVKCESAAFFSTVEMPPADRGANGFGSTGQ